MQKKEKPDFVFLEHMADIKARLFGSSLNEIFENSAAAFSSYINSGKKIKKVQTKTINTEGDDVQSLLYNFLDELIYLLDAEDFAVSVAKVNIDKKGKTLSATLKGDSTKNYHLNHVKAATYAEMYINNKGKVWEAQIVLDV